MDQYSILLVDNEVSNLRALERTLRNNYNTLSAVNGESMINLMEQNEIALVLVNYRAPGISDFKILETAFQRYPDTIYIILVAYSDEDLITNALKSGRIYGYITKPWEPEEVKAIVRDGVSTYELNHAFKEPIARALFDSGIVTKEQLETALNIQRTEVKSLKEILSKYRIISADQLESVIENQKSSHKDLEEILLDTGILLPSELEEVKELQRTDRKKLTDIIINLGYANEDEVFSCFSARLGLPYLPLSQFSGKIDSGKLLPKKIILKNGIFPVDLISQTIVLSVSEPLSDKVKKEIELETGYRPAAFCSSYEEIQVFLDEFFKNQNN